MCAVQKAQIGFGGFGLQWFSFPGGFWVFIEERIVLEVLGSVVKSAYGAADVRDLKELQSFNSSF